MKAFLSIVAALILVFPAQGQILPVKADATTGVLNTPTNLQVGIPYLQGAGTGAVAALQLAINGTGGILTFSGLGSVTQAYSANLATWSGKAPYAGTITVTSGKTFNVPNTLTLSGTDGSTLNVGAGGTLGSAAFTLSSAYDAAGTAASATLSGNAAFVDAVNGIDSTGAVGSRSHSFLTIGAAVTAANAVATSTNPVVVRVGPGTFTVTNIACSAYVSLIGSGEGVTNINSAAIISGTGFVAAAIWTPGSHTFNGYFTLNSTAASTDYSVLVGPYITPSTATDVVIHSVRLNGYSDGIYIVAPSAPIGMTFYDCVFNTTYDNFNFDTATSSTVVGSRIDFYNCVGIVTGPFAAGGGPGRCLSVGSSSTAISTTALTVRWFGGSMSVSNMEFGDYAIQTHAHGVAEVYGCVFNITGSGAYNFGSTDATGSIAYNACSNVEHSALTVDPGASSTPVNLATQLGTVTSGSIPYALLTGTPSALPPSGTAGGDLGGTYPSPTVTSGTHLGSATVPNSALQSSVVLTTGTQTISGAKSFSSQINMIPTGMNPAPIDFGAAYGAPALILYDDGSGPTSQYGWGISGGIMEFFNSSQSNNFYFSYGGFHPVPDSSNSLAGIGPAGMTLYSGQYISPSGASVPSVVASITGINAQTVANTLLYVVPTGKTFIPTSVVVRATAATSISSGPTANVYTVTAQDIYSSQGESALTTAGKIFTFPNTGMGLSVPAGGTINFGITTGATGTSETVTVDLIGYLE